MGFGSEADINTMPSVNTHQIYTGISPRPGFALFEITHGKAKIKGTEGRGLGTMKAEMLACYTTRLEQYIDRKPYIFVCLLDTNIKGLRITDNI